MNYSVRLLTKTECKNYGFMIPRIGRPWWLLNDDDTSDEVSYSNSDNSVNSTDCPVFEFGIRPALVITDSNCPMEIFECGSEIKVGKYKWTVLHSSKERCLALCTQAVKQNIWGGKTSYEKSEIKKWLEEEFNIFNFCKFCFDCTCDPDGGLTPENDFSSITIGKSVEGHRVMFSSGWGKPPRIEVDVWSEEMKRWITVSSYTPNFCPNCGRKLNEYEREEKAVNDFEKGQWDIFLLLSTARLGKEYYYLHDDEKTVFSRLTQKHMSIDEAVKEFSLYLQREYQ